MLFADNNDYDAHGCTNATISVDMYAQGGRYDSGWLSALSPHGYAYRFALEASIGTKKHA